MLPAVYSFTQKLDSKQIKYTHNEAVEGGRKENIHISFRGDHGNTLSPNFFFDADGTTVNIILFSICKVESNKLMDMYVLLNQLNADYRWVKFYLDQDDEVTVSGDAVIDVETAGEELYELMNRFVGITDDVYPQLMKVIWG